MKTIITPSVKNTALAIVTMALCLSSQPGNADEHCGNGRPNAALQAELPYGIAIPSHPGFVKSPYAAEHQLVDVTGLPTGMEVKCPYTGKLFRVPPMTTAIAQAEPPSDALIFGSPSSWMSKNALLA